MARLLTDESGQDLIEYALLSTFIGLCAVVTMELLGNTMNTVYQSWDGAVQDVWEVPPPATTP